MAAAWTENISNPGGSRPGARLPSRESLLPNSKRENLECDRAHLSGDRLGIDRSATTSGASAAVPGAHGPSKIELREPGVRSRSVLERSRSAFVVVQQPKARVQS